MAADLPFEIVEEPPPAVETPAQVGPLRHWDREMRCASRGCSSSTHHTVCGVPRCMIHAMRELNEMLHELGVEN